MELRDKRRRSIHLEAGALSDILFFLLIFFLITSTLANPNVIKLTRPKSSSVDKTKEKPTVVVSINEDHEVYINRTLTTMDALQSDLEKAVAEAFGALEAVVRKEEPTILLNVANGVTAEEIVKVMEIAQYKLKAKISLATDKPKAP